MLVKSLLNARIGKTIGSPSQVSQYFRGGGSFRSFVVSFDNKLAVEVISGKLIGGGLSED